MNDRQRLVIVAIALVALSVGVLLVNTQGIDSGPNKSKAKSECKALYDAVGMYMLDHGYYPNRLCELMHNLKGHKYLSGYLDVPRDPWGNDYVYEMIDAEAGEYRITSYGSDGQPGGTDDARDRAYPPLESSVTD